MHRHRRYLPNIRTDCVLLEGFVHSTSSDYSSAGGDSVTGLGRLSADDYRLLGLQASKPLHT
eukprot:scaffold566942_cov18-Prasinocladus_malaysianus.AAC.1